MTNHPNTDDFDLSRIATKVRALMALAENNPNEHEATAAAAKAQELLIAYNLDLSSANEDSERGYRKFKGGLYKWQRKLWEAIAELHFCMYWSEKGNYRGAKYEHKLLGRTVNVVSAKVLAEYLEQAISRLTADRFTTKPSVFFSKEAIAYREGIADRLVERLQAKREEQRAEADRRKREEEAKARHPGSPSSGKEVALFLTDLEQKERDENADILWGLPIGTHAQRRLERKAEWARQQEEARKRREAEEEADRMLQIEDPEAWQRKQEELAEAKRQKDAADEKAWREFLKKQARNEKRRKGTGYTAPKGPRAETYYEGRQDAEDISLDDQIDREKRRTIE